MKKPAAHRSAITGRFVSAEYAARHPDTTIAERGRRIRTRPAKKKRRN